MNAKKKDVLNLGVLIVGAVFLFNPTINIIDILPDFIGYWLIAYGLTGWAYMSDLLMVGRKNFIFLAFLEAVKLAVCFTLPGATGTFVTLMTFSFCVAEAVLFIPAVSNMFEGFSALAMRHGMSGGHINTTGIKFFTIIAFIVRAIGALIPTLPSLMLYGDTLFVTSGQLNWSKFVGIFYIVAWITGLAVGIPWLCKFIKYIKAVNTNEAFKSVVCEKYVTEILSDKGRLEADRMKKVMILAVSASALSFQFPVDYVNAVPNFLTAGCIAAALLYLMPLSKKLSVAGVVTSGLWAVLSAVGIWLQTDYRKENYTPPAAVAFGGEGRGMADELYFRMEIFSYAEALFFLITAVIFGIVFINAVNQHISMMPPRRDGLERDARVLEKCLLPVVICCCVIVLFNFALTFVTKYFTAAWIINALGVIVFFIFSLRAYYRLSDTVYLSLRRKF